MPKTAKSAKKSPSAKKPAEKKPDYNLQTSRKLSGLIAQVQELSSKIELMKGNYDSLDEAVSESLEAIANDVGKIMNQQIAVINSPTDTVSTLMPQINAAIQEKVEAMSRALQIELAQLKFVKKAELVGYVLDQVAGIAKLAGGRASLCCNIHNDSTFWEVNINGSAISISDHALGAVTVAASNLSQTNTRT